MVFLLMVLARGSSIQENRIAHWGKGVESSELKNANITFTKYCTENQLYHCGSLSEFTPNT